MSIHRGKSFLITAAILFHDTSIHMPTACSLSGRVIVRAATLCKSLFSFCVSLFSTICPPHSADYLSKMEEISRSNEELSKHAQYLEQDVLLMKASLDFPSLLDFVHLFRLHCCTSLLLTCSPSPPPSLRPPGANRIPYSAPRVGLLPPSRGRDGGGGSGHCQDHSVSQHTIMSPNSLRPVLRPSLSHFCVPRALIRSLTLLCTVHSPLPRALF